ncbi:MAG: TonB-dependent receptor [Bacteroidota bacterium]
MKKVFPYSIGKAKWVFYLLCLSLFNNLEAQYSIEGQILNNFQEPITNAAIKIEPSEQGTISDENGNFVLNNLDQGRYILFISHLTYDVLRIPLEIKNSNVQLGQLELNSIIGNLSEIVVTATRTERKISDIAVPVSVISKETIEQMGSVRLNEVLAEQTGLIIDSDHGTGIQMQGFNADYTMILINGQPMIGRTAGTLNLDRISVNNIERIEITKGPSSSLYGSEALAGVINIITKQADSFALDAIAKFRSFNTQDYNLNLDFKEDKLNGSVSYNLYRSDGYDLTPETIGQTASPFDAHTITSSLGYDFEKLGQFRLFGRYYDERQNDQTEFLIEDQNELLNFEGVLRDWNLTPEWTLTRKENKFIVSNYSSQYKTNSDYYFASSNEVYDASFFDQFFNKSEVQWDNTKWNKNTLSIGLGHIRERLKSTRYRGINRFQTNYAFVQNDWRSKNDKLNIIAGFRFDDQSEYGQQFSPKFASQYTLSKRIKLKGSFGRGFKAPDFRQLFLDFTNPVVGYSVFGSSLMPDALEELISLGQIQSVFFDLSDLEELRAESSNAINLGASVQFASNINWNINFFRNDIEDLIEAAPVALKTNGQQVFTYFNLNRVYTQGLETEFFYNPLVNFKVSVGYQYLIAKDKEVEEEISNGTVFAIDPETGSTVRVSEDDYGGLFNRSAHSANVKLFYDLKKFGTRLNLRGIYRGAFGFGDLNNNGILDAEFEYTDAIFTGNFSVLKSFKSNPKLQVQFGIDNLTDQRNTYVPSMPGRIIYGAIFINLSNQKSSQ